jgi:diacylglycerol kinase family enzyme
MATSRVLVIENPVASGVTPRVRQRILDALAPYAQCDLASTARPLHAIELAAAAGDQQFDAIIVMAGDGTMNEVLNGAATTMTIGVLPCGGTNVLARAFGLPRDPVAAATRIGQALAAKRTRPIRLATLNGRRFAFSGGIGLDADVVRRVDAAGRRRGRRPGDAYFAVQLARTVLSRRYATPRATLDVAGERYRVASVICANIHPWTYVGAVGVRTAPLADPEAGFDVIGADRLALRDVPRLAVEMLVTGAHSRGGDRHLVYRHDQQHARVVCDRPTPAEVDGDDIGDVTEALLGTEHDPRRILV